MFNPEERVVYSIQTRPLSEAEGQSLQRTVRKGRDAIARKRAACVLSSAQGLTVSQIAKAQLLHETYVRKILNAFNAEDLKSLGARYGIGCPRQFTEEQCAKMVALALPLRISWDYPLGLGRCLNCVIM